MNILVADDSPEMVQIVSAYLKKMDLPSILLLMGKQRWLFFTVKS